MREYVGILKDDQTSANRGEREPWKAECKAGEQSLSITLCSLCNARTEVWTSLLDRNCSRAPKSQSE